MLKVTEIYHSIQGEGSRAGLACVFIRLSGCNLRCTWCDTEYGYSGGKDMELSEVLEQVSKYNCQLVEVTGGEPLMQEECSDLVELLLEKDYTVLVETSGAYDISTISDKAVRIVDMKCPGSGMVERNDYKNLEKLSANDELKFVVADKLDFDWSCDLIKKFDLNHRENNFISPVYGETDMESLAKWILDSELNIRLQVQLHKFIWGPDKTGV